MQRPMTLAGGVVLTLAVACVNVACVKNDRLFDDSMDGAELDAPAELAPGRPLETGGPETGTVVPVGREAPLSGGSFESPPVQAPSDDPESAFPEEPAPSGGGDVAGEQTATGCESGSIVPGDLQVGVTIDGLARRYLLHVPASYDGKAPVPLVVDLHGMTTGVLEHVALSGWREKSDAVGFIVAYPEGFEGSWNGGSLCCGSSMLEGIDDEGFIRSLVQRVEREACIDPKRVYATGISSGGAMAHLLACRSADVFAATAPVSMGNGTTPCEPSRPISVVMARGLLDLVARYDGSSEYPGAEEDFDHWRDLNACSGEPEAGGEDCVSYRDCAAGVEVMACSVLGQHVLYENIARFSVADVAWGVFERHPRP